MPFVTPFIGLAPGVGAGVGAVIGTVALLANFYSIHRFWKTNHRWKWPVTALHVGVIILLFALLYFDIRELLS